MRDAASASRRFVSGQVNRIIDTGIGHDNAKYMGLARPASLIDATRATDESVLGKWEQLQYYENNEWRRGRLQSPRSGSEESGFSSGSDRSSVKTKLKVFKKEGMKRFQSLKNQLTGKKEADPAPNGHASNGVVSSSPAGGGQGVIPRIRASKSMQNLSQMTRDSYFGLRDLSANLKNKYSSRMELSRAQPRTEYKNFYDEDSDLDEEEIRLMTMKMVGLA